MRRYRSWLCRPFLASPFMRLACGLCDVVGHVEALAAGCRFIRHVRHIVTLSVIGRVAIRHRAPLSNTSGPYPSRFPPLPSAVVTLCRMCRQNLETGER